MVESKLGGIRHDSGFSVPMIGRYIGFGADQLRRSRSRRNGVQLRHRPIRIGFAASLSVWHLFTIRSASSECRSACACLPLACFPCPTRLNMTTTSPAIAPTTHTTYAFRICTPLGRHILLLTAAAVVCSHQSTSSLETGVSCARTAGPACRKLQRCRLRRVQQQDGELLRLLSLTPLTPPSLPPPRPLSPL